LCTFFVNDPVKTVTTWENGNQGANSLFLANHAYPVERYVQKSITVEAKRADALIDSGVGIPSIIWLDAQGSELNILESFGKYLNAIDFVYVELSLYQLYLDTPLANEVVKFLGENGFYWVANLTLGGYQFDAVFVRASRKKTLARIHHKFLNWSLKTKRKLFISMNFWMFCRAIVSQVIKALFRIK